MDHHVQRVHQYPGPELNDLWIMADGTNRLKGWQKTASPKPSVLASKGERITQVYGP